MSQQHADLQPQAGAQPGHLLPCKPRHQTNGTRAQRDERVDGVACQHAADHIGHSAHGKAGTGAEQQRCQQHRQAAQIEPHKAGGDAQHPAEHDAHCHQQGQHGERADGIFRVVHINCPPCKRNTGRAVCTNENALPVTNRTKEGVNPTTFTSGRDASRLACTQVHAAAGCRPCTAGTPSSTAQLPVDAALNAHGLTLLMALL